MRTAIFVLTVLLAFNLAAVARGDDAPPARKPADEEAVEKPATPETTPRLKGTLTVECWMYTCADGKVRIDFLNKG